MSARDSSILSHMIADWRERDPDRRVLTFVDIAEDGSFLESYRNYRELWDNGQRVAAALAAAGMAQGDRFAIMMQNHPEFVDAMVGSSIAATIFVPIDPRTQGRKLQYMLDFAECSGVFIADYALPRLLAVAAELPKLRWAWVLCSRPAVLPAAPFPLLDFATVLAEPVPDLPILSQDSVLPMQMLYTSGTTGDPKAILSPHARFGGVAALGPAIGLTPEDRPYSGLSLTHANAQLITLGNVLKMGLYGTFSRRFTKSRLWDITRAYGCTTFNLLGGMTTAIYSEPERADDAENPVRYVLAAGMPAAIWEKFSRRFDLQIFEFYATAEGGLSMNPSSTGPIGSIGRPPPSMVARIFDERDQECPPGVQGELVFRNADGSCPPVAYYKNEAASRAKIRGGWFRTGDICHTDSEGWLYFDYRDGDAIRCNGDFINPTYIEKEIAEHPDVDDVFVYGVEAASKVPGESDVVAAVVLRSEHPPDPVALYTWCRAHLERSSVPAYLQVLEEIPKTASEKPMKRFCRRLLHERRDYVFAARDFP
ncbi:MAG: AMP-binding protein [Gammaproteobacteria bacterium]